MDNSVMRSDMPRICANHAAAAIIFDLDGTLVDDEHAVEIAPETFRSQYREWLPMSSQDLKRQWMALLDLHFGRYLAGEISMQEQRRARLRDVFETAIPVLPDKHADEMFAVYERAYRQAWIPFSDAVPALAALTPFRLAVLTNGNLALQVEKLQNAGLLEYFTDVFASSEIGFAKPHPEAFQEACRRLGIEPGRCIYIGDNLKTDAEGSFAAGLVSVWLNRVPSGGVPSEGIPIIHSLAELPELLRTNGRLDGLL